MGHVLQELADVEFDQVGERGAQMLYLRNSPVGFSAVPQTVGGNGWVFSMDRMVAF